MVLRPDYLWMHPTFRIGGIDREVALERNSDTFVEFSIVHLLFVVQVGLGC
jgi:hypothetical protein